MHVSTHFGHTTYALQTYCFFMLTLGNSTSGQKHQGFKSMQGSTLEGFGWIHVHLMSNWDLMMQQNKSVHIVSYGIHLWILSVNWRRINVQYPDHSISTYPNNNHKCIMGISSTKSGPDKSNWSRGIASTAVAILLHSMPSMVQKFSL